MDKCFYDDFMCQFKRIQKEVHQTAIKKGWWDGGDGNKGEKIALCHSELSEALEGLRNNIKSDKILKFLSVEEELADTIIRIMDMSERYNYRIASAIVAKMEYNKNRKHRHGGKLF